jgi:nucleotide-binding universal stress UspA family protein
MTFAASRVPSVRDDRTAEFVAKRAMSRRWPDAQVRVVDASPVDAIIREAARLQADVIVMGWGAHGTSGALASTRNVAHVQARNSPEPPANSLAPAGKWTRLSLTDSGLLGSLA